MKPRTKAAKTDSETIFRVVRLTQDARQAIKDMKRTGSMDHNQAVIDSIVEQHLSTLVESLIKLGFAALARPQKLYRLPFSDSTLTALKEASEKTGVAASHIFLLICLISLVEQKPTRKTKKGAK